MKGHARNTKNKEHNIIEKVEIKYKTMSKREQVEKGANRRRTNKTRQN